MFNTINFSFLLRFFLQKNPVVNSDSGDGERLRVVDTERLRWRVEDRQVLPACQTEIRSSPAGQGHTVKSPDILTLNGR